MSRARHKCYPCVTKRQQTKAPHICMQVPAGHSFCMVLPPRHPRGPPSISISAVQIYLDKLQDLFQPEAPELNITPDTERVEMPDPGPRWVPR